MLVCYLISWHIWKGSILYFYCFPIVFQPKWNINNTNNKVHKILCKMGNNNYYLSNKQKHSQPFNFYHQNIITFITVYIWFPMRFQLILFFAINVCLHTYILCTHLLYSMHDWMPLCCGCLLGARIGIAFESSGGNESVESV